VSWEFWRKSQAHGVCVEGEMGLCVCLCVEIRGCVEEKIRCGFLFVCVCK